MAIQHWKLDPTHSTIEFSTKHMMFTTVRGRFKKFDGVLNLDRDAPDTSSATVEVEAASIDTSAESRDAHLRSAEFFDAERYPTITFKSSDVNGAAPEEGKRFRVAGQLTIADTTQEIVLDMMFQGRATNPSGQEIVGFTGSTEIDRRDWGLKWNQTLETGGVLVANKVRIEVDVQAVLQDDRTEDR